jgi:hypothetical protein
MKGVMHVSEKPRWPLAFAVCAAFFLAACGTLPLVPPVGEEPIFTRIDARVGVVYTSAASTATIANPLMRIEVGKASVAGFERVFSSNAGTTEEHHAAYFMLLQERIGNAGAVGDVLCAQ